MSTETLDLSAALPAHEAPDPEAPNADVSNDEAPDAEAPAACVSCGTVRVGPFCHACGEKRLDRHDYAFLHYTEHAVDALTHLDVKVFKSVWSLVARPGAMAADVLAGRRVRWTKPFQAFFVANLIFYLGVSAIGTSFFDAPLDIQLATRSYARPLAEAKAASLGLTMEAYAETYNALSHTLFVILVPVVAGLLALLFVRHKRYFLEHMTVGALALSQFMLVSLLAILVVGLPLAFLGIAAGDAVMVPAVLLSNVAVFFLTFRRVYPGRAAVTAVKTFAFVFLVMVAIMEVFRPILFLITNAFT